MDLRETGLEDLEWIELAQNRNIRRAVLNAEMKLRIPSNAENFLTKKIL